MDATTPKDDNGLPQPAEGVAENREEPHEQRAANRVHLAWV